MKKTIAPKKTLKLRTSKQTPSRGSRTDAPAQPKAPPTEDGSNPEEAPHQTSATGRLRAIFLAVMARLLSGADLKQKQLALLAGVASDVALEIQRVEKPTTWGDAEHRRMSQLRAQGHLGVGARVVGHIAEMPPPRTFQPPEGDRIVGVVLTLKGIDGDIIETLGVVGDEAIAKIQSLRDHGLLEFLVRPVLVPTSPGASRSDFALEIVDMRKTTSALDALGATRADRRDTEALLKDLRARSVSPLNHIQAKVECGLGVVGLAKLPVLRLLLRGTILQSVSIGRFGKTPAKLHILVVGPPGHGKKLIILAARALNPICREGSAAKISVAGLVGASSCTAQGWQSQPGLLPAADGGVLLLQDAHAVQGSKMRQLAPVLMELIEDGELRDAVAAGRHYKASVGLVIDLNRLRQVSAEDGSEAPILGIRPLMSRIDLIAEIEENADLAWDVSEAIYESIGTSAPSFDDAPWVREVRLLVATLRDRHPTINIDGKVSAQMTAAHRLIRKENAAFIATMPEAGDIPMRLGISFTRFVVASARAHDRDTATREDVLEALAFVGKKLEFLKMAPVLDPKARPRSPLERVGDDVWDHLSCQADFTEQDVMQRFQDLTGTKVAARTARNWMQKIGAKRVGKGRYVLPTAGVTEPKPSK